METAPFLGGSQAVSPLQVAKWMVRCRRGFSRFFDPDLIGDPARDILLHLFVGAEEERQVSTTSTCLASGVPPTTALRHIEILKGRGLVAAAPDPVDGRRVWLAITPEAREKMRDYLKTVARSRL